MTPTDLELPELLARLSKRQGEKGPAWMAVFDGSSVSTEGGMGLAASSRPTEDGGQMWSTPGGGQLEERPSLLGGNDYFVNGHYEAHSFPNGQGGADFRGADGSMLGSIDDNIFGGVNVHGPDGHIELFTQPAGLDREVLIDDHGATVGWANSNDSGGIDLDGMDGMLSEDMES